MIDPYSGGGAFGMGVPTTAWMGGSAVVAILVTKAIDAFLNRRANRAQENQLIAAADGSAGLIEKLNARIVALEGRQSDIENRLNEETEKRLKAQEEVSRQRQRIATLVSIMRHHKIEVPPEELG